MRRPPAAFVTRIKESDLIPMASMFLLNSLMVGGSVKKTARIANALKDRGHELHVGYLSPPDTLRKDFDPQIPIRFFDRKGKFEFRIAAELRDYIQANGIGNLLCINLYPSTYGVLCAKLPWSSAPGVYIFINITDFQNRKEHLQMLLYRRLLRMASGIVFGCRRQMEEWTRRYVLPRDRSSVIYNGVDCSFFSPGALEADPSALREKFGFSPGEVVIVSVAEFRPEKAQEDLVRACDALRRKGCPVRLVLVGDGPTRKRTEQLATGLGLGEIVQFRGRVGDVRPDLSAADIFALPSTAVETFSNAALEAMAMEKPVVLSDIGGASEMVREGENGYLFPPGEGAGLTEKLEILVKDAASRRRMGSRGREMARERFGFGTMLEEYERLLQSPAPGPAGAVPSEKGDLP